MGASVTREGLDAVFAQEARTDCDAYVTITESEAFDLTIPATDDLLSGYIGPVLVLQDDKPWVYTGRRFDAHYIVPTAWSKHDILTEFLHTYDVRFPLSRPEVQAHLVGWLGREEWCAACDGSGFDGPVETSTKYGCVACGGSTMKRGSGYLRKPFDRYSLFPPHPRGGLPDWIRLALLYANIVRVAGGMSAIDGLLGPRYRVSRVELRRDVLYGRGAGIPGAGMSFLHSGGVADIEGHEHLQMSAEARALMDETPTGRAIRFEVPNG